MAWWRENGIKVVCFDIDGTLYPKTILNRKMLATLFPHALTALRFMKMRSLFRQSQNAVPTVPATLEGMRRRQAQLVLQRRGMPATEENLSRVEDAFVRHIYGRWEESYHNLRPFPHVKDAMVQMKDNGMLLGVMSDFPVAGKIDSMGMSALVDVAVSSEESGYLKPHPAAFSYLLEKMGNPNPSVVLYIGDSYDKDVEGAYGMGMKSCLLAERRSIGGGKRTDFPHADLICTSWADFSRQFF
ncbi:HAD family hydrolase [Parasphaerochaeta coccoides]|uniref:Haloacid dehalogenase domain protein hydrolase n=1 Tax=Parasphaerochaeta coccoides (strain ATCC BAA-1237 / DSM 17374 / SPN1) TaxID=760011 RepID=F4GKJ8_PARC1|nr:HAD family hydrolase [Parasphaerochaeta coccoides]AEC02881.1 Haloacid dehalogenase domain protein hydrolase [Parasphaerochaeta coccoides DSM 17374]